MNTKHIVIAGGSGFMGQNLSNYLLDNQHHVTILSRSKPKNHNHSNLNWHQWDNQTLGPWSSSLNNADAIINLVGRTVDCRKTPEQRKEILGSRIDSVNLIGKSIRQLDNPPPIWIQAGTAHIFGDPIPQDTIITDNSPLGTGFAPDVGAQWEQALHKNLLPNQRHVNLRTSFVLGSTGGALKRMATLTRLGLGGKLGSGKQYISWIHESDMTQLIVSAIDDPTYTGTYLITSPNPVTNTQFMQTLRKVCRRPWSPPVPSLAVKFGARFIMNTDPELALLGRRCIPTRLQSETPFKFQYPNLQPALENLLQ
ncbi:TIGR01777 family oxidoreductase [Planctomycetota bacterium]|nr:TIGR01777 family oxidoreductase [Planctomycetota bacterium]